MRRFPAFLLLVDGAMLLIYAGNSLFSVIAHMHAEQRAVDTTSLLKACLEDLGIGSTVLLCNALLFGFLALIIGLVMWWRRRPQGQAAAKTR